MNLSGWLGDHLDNPMYIVTACSNGRRAGCLVGFAAQCSIDPLRFMVFLSKQNHTYRVACDAQAIAVHLVPEDGRDLAELFGGETGDEVDKFARCEWRPGLGEAPILKRCVSWFSGAVVGRTDVGDHLGFLLDPMEGSAEPAGALGFQAVRDIPPGHPA